MEIVKIGNGVDWVGIQNEDVRYIHGEELSIPNGTSYNSYIIKDEKVVLIDSVQAEFSKVWIEKIKKVVDLNKIDYVIMNHNEPDHSGGLIELLKEVPDLPIYCTAEGEKILKGYYHRDFNCIKVKTGDTLNIGKRTLTFVEMKMLHWPDSMMTYSSFDNVLYSNDAFGEHFAATELFNDLVDQEILEQETLKYYACILNPFSPILERKLTEVLSLNLTIDIICPSHGVVWRKNPLQIVEKYLKWCKDYKENQITIIYDTMWGSTEIMAENIAKGIKNIDTDVVIKLFNSAKTCHNELSTEIFKSKAILFGSGTINNGILPSMASLLESVRGLAFKNKSTGAFGSSGWNDKSVSVLNELLEKTRLTLVDEGLKLKWKPDAAGIKSCIEYGENFVNKIK
ncbi:MAG: flavodoxin domain-containing protein [Psychrilyobacter sp.]|nr:flavodoxin domain-containing protein [Psychrilyobacter sp.]